MMSKASSGSHGSRCQLLLLFLHSLITIIIVPTSLIIIISLLAINTTTTVTVATASPIPSPVHADLRPILQGGNVASQIGILHVEHVKGASHSARKILEAVSVDGPLRSYQEEEELMGYLERCEDGDDECVKRRVISEAHLDYIYTQQHGKP